jgi:hypothetical protein
MNAVEKVLLENIDNPKACFIFPTEIAASRWADHLLGIRGGTVAMRKFIAWDTFKRDSMRSKVQNKKSVPSALRTIFTGRLIRENAELTAQGKAPFFTSLIRKEWALQASHFTSWIASLLPQLALWYAKSTGRPVNTILAETVNKNNFDAEDNDMYNLAYRYAQFLEQYGLFEPAWETPPFDDASKDCYIFFPESLSDYGEYRELLAASDHVKTIYAENAGNIPCDTFFYTNSRSEITEASLYIRALREKGVEWDSIAVCIPDSRYYEPYVLQEFKNRNIPFVKRSGKALSDYPAGMFFSAVLKCCTGDFSFTSFTNLVLNANLPWRYSALIHALAGFGIENNCICSWVETVNGTEKKINVWEEAFKRPYGRLDPRYPDLFNSLRKHLLSLRNAQSFAEIRREYFVFRENFFDMELCGEETNLILSRCISELMYLCEIEKDFPDVKPVDPFKFFTEYLREVVYLAQQTTSGVSILPYKTAACAPFDCHIVLGANQKSLSEVFSELQYLPRNKREKLGMIEEDASCAFIGLQKYNSFRQAAFFCAERTFSGYEIPHSGINAQEKPSERYAQINGFQDKFAADYFKAESNNDISILHEVQNKGFNEWKLRRKTRGQGGGIWKSSDVIENLIKEFYSNNESQKNKYGVSASSLSIYYQCSLKWLFQRVLNVENNEIDASLMADNIIGDVYHAVLCAFFDNFKELSFNAPDFLDDIPVPPDSYKSMLQTAIDGVFAIFPKLHPDKETKMSGLTAMLLLAEKHIIQYRIERFLGYFLLYFSGCTVIGAEIPYQSGRDTYFFKGNVDIVLKNELNEYIIIDFKTKKTPKRDDCTEELADFQMPMYITLTEDNKKITVTTALFFSIIDKTPQVIFGTIKNINTNEVIPKKEEDRIMRGSEKAASIFNEFINKSERYAREISSCDFSVFQTEYAECKECMFSKICRTVYKINGIKIQV